MEAARIEKYKGEVDVGESRKIELLRGNLEFRESFEADFRTWHLQIGMSEWQPKTRSIYQLLSTTSVFDIELCIPNIALIPLGAAARGSRRRSTSAETLLTPSITKIRCASAKPGFKTLSHRNMSNG